MRPPMMREPSPAEERAVRFLRGLGRATIRLAAFAAIAGLVSWIALLRALSGDEATGVLVVTAVLVLTPPAILLLFAFALRALRMIPQRLREAPGTLRDRAGEIRRAAGEIGSRRRGFLARLRPVARLWRTVSSSRELVDEIAPAAMLLSPWMLGAAATSAVAAVVEILVGAVALVLLVVGGAI